MFSAEAKNVRLVSQAVSLSLRGKKVNSISDNLTEFEHIIGPICPINAEFNRQFSMRLWQIDLHNAYFSHSRRHGIDLLSNYGFGKDEENGRKYSI